MKGVLHFLLASPQDRFAKRFMTRLRQRGWIGALTYVKPRFSIETEDGRSYDLQRIFEDVRTYSRARRAAVFDEALNLFFEPPILGSEVELPHLLPVVRGLHELRELGPGEDAPTQRLAGSLGAALVFDRPHSLQYLTGSDMALFALPSSGLRARALENLKARKPCDFQLQADGYYVVDYGDVYASSRLLQPEAFEALPLEGAPVVMVPARGVLLVAGAKQPNALESMAGFADYVWRNDNCPIACTPFALQDGVWTLFNGGAEPSLAIRRLHALQQVWDYDLQGKALAAEFESTGDELFVAKLAATERDGELLTYATWTDGVDTLLPKAEALILHDADWNSIQRWWSDVETVCGPFVQEPGMDPPRYRSGAGPDAEAWRRLRDEFRQPYGWPDLA